MGSKTFDIDNMDGASIPPPVPTGARRPSDFGLFGSTTTGGAMLPTARSSTPTLGSGGDKLSKEEKKAQKAVEKLEAADAKAVEKARVLADKVKAKEYKAEEKARAKEEKRLAKGAAKKK
jgi:hypothetical protein